MNGRARLLRMIVAVGAATLWAALAANAQTSTSENIILGRPTSDSVSIHALAGEGTAVFAQYGEMLGNYSGRTTIVESSVDNVADISIEGLKSNTRYYYRLSYRGPEDTTDQPGEEHSFHTQRSKGSTFSFGVQGDSHPEAFYRTGMGARMFHPDLYTRTMEQVASDQPDLYFMLGDDFSISLLGMADFFAGDRDQLNQRVVDDVYLNQRNFLGHMANSTALFAVNGNHEEARRAFLGTPLHDLAVFAGRARTRFLPLPTPDHFYTGNPEPVPGIGLLRDYYAFTWGDALFVTIDPYWHSPVQVGNSGGGMGMGTWSTPPSSELQAEYENVVAGAQDRWASTMGDQQYQWFKETLEDSDAKYKFVFAHHVLGGGRGGIERATDFEWGGHSADGTWEFDERRPDWELPVHQLMVKHGVTIFFQSHDHLFVRQELDGIVYQSVPVPADDLYTGRNKDAYLTGDILDNSGYVNVTVSPERLEVDYIRSYMPKDEVGGRRQGEVAFSYMVE
jgi:hypothetical protein